MEHYLGVAKEEGISERELGAVQAVVMAVSAGRINAQVRDVRSRATYANSGRSWGKHAVDGNRE
jgi:hypothetical protein